MVVLHGRERIVCIGFQSASLRSGPVRKRKYKLIMHLLLGPLSRSLVYTFTKYDIYHNIPLSCLLTPFHLKKRRVIGTFV
jgi:hypothetical protein